MWTLDETANTSDMFSWAKQTGHLEYLKSFCIEHRPVDDQLGICKLFFELQEFQYFKAVT